MTESTILGSKLLIFKKSTTIFLDQPHQFYYE